MDKSLEELLDEKRQKTEIDRAGLEERKADWLARISKLYTQIEGWLKLLVDKKHVKQIGRQRYEVSEELLGTYASEKLTITFYNNQTIELLPKGLHIIGANGRIDLDMRGTLVMILGREDGTGWNFLEAFGGRALGGVAVRGQYRPATRPTPELLPFTQENFEALLARFVQGF